MHSAVCLRWKTSMGCCKIGSVPASPLPHRSKFVISSFSRFVAGTNSPTSLLLLFESLLKKDSLSRLTHFRDMLLPQLAPVDTRWDDASKSLLRCPFFPSASTQYSSSCPHQVVGPESRKHELDQVTATQSQWKVVAHVSTSHALAHYCVAWMEQNS